MNNTFFLDHYGKRWFALEFTDAKDIDFMLNNRPWYVHRQIFHLEPWTTQFNDLNAITKLLVWAHLPCVPVQYKEASIIKTIAQPLRDILLVDDVTLNLNGLFFKVLVEVDL